MATKKKQASIEEQAHQTWMCLSLRWCFYFFTMLNHHEKIPFGRIYCRTCFQSSCVIFQQQNVDVNPGMDQFVQVLRAWMPFVPLHGVMEITLPWRWGCFGWGLQCWWRCRKVTRNLPSSWWQMGTLLFFHWTMIMGGRVGVKRLVMIGHF